ncbi:hypothetical protein EJ997_10130 [Flaviflexus ciconiae]|uniref:Uncharacterized protein n=1 Tax=Flaviflexus ciconiae TaxID=2496867 RepID=A0A3Q9G7V1_9ACTO|nr:hypothetical protein [Flaviflexus ciconiae]AZQ77641.1 hypothetical protein EJ997_10130 [Flaviflexus ciconiae]
MAQVKDLFVKINPSLKVKHDRAILDLEDLRLGPSFSVGDVRLPVIHENDGDLVMNSLAQKWVDQAYALIQHPSDAPTSPARIRTAVFCLQRAIKLSHQPPGETA